MPVAIPAVMAITAVVSAVAGGISVYSSMEQADTAKRVAAYNAEVQKQQADLNMKVQQRQSEINQSLIQSQLNQVASQESMEQRQLQNASEQARREREQKLRLLGAQSAGFAKAGVGMEGSALAVFQDTELQSALQEHDIFSKAEQVSRSQGTDMAMTRLNLNTQMEQEKMNYSLALAGRNVGYQNAALTLAQGNSQSAGYRMQGVGTLLSTVASTAQSGVNAYNYSPTPKGYKAV